MAVEDKLDRVLENQAETQRTLGRLEGAVAGSVQRHQTTEKNVSEMDTQLTGDIHTLNDRVTRHRRNLEHLVETKHKEATDRYDSLAGVVTGHGSRLDKNDGDIREIRTAARRSDLTPGGGSITLGPTTWAQNPVVRIVLGKFVEWGVVSIVGLVIYALTHGAKIPLFS